MKRLNFIAIPLIMLFCFGGMIAGAKLTGYWTTERSATPRLLAEGNTYDPYDIRGSYTINEVLEFFNIPKEDFYTGLNIPSDMCGDSQLKELEELALTTDETEHFGVSDVRDFVAAFIGYVPPATTTVTPEDESKSSNTIANSTTPVFAQTNQSGIVSENAQKTASEVTPSTTVEHTESYTEPRGGTPLSQVYAWGVTKEMLEKQFNINFTKANLTPESTLKEMADAAGVSMSDVKSYVTAQMKK